MSKDMCAGNRPNFNTDSGLTPNGGLPAGAPPGSALERNATRLPKASIAALLLLFALATPAAGQIATGGVMRFSTDEVAFIGGFGGVAADVWLVESFAYLSHDAGVWAIQAGAAAPVVRIETVRVSIRFGTSTAVSGPAVEPDIHPTIGAGVRLGRPVRGHGRGGPGRGGPGQGVHADARWPLRQLVRTCRCPRSPGGSSPSPTPSASSRSSTGTLLTRRDIERLFGVGKVRAAALMKTFGAELVGNQRTLPRTKLLQQLKKHRGRAAFRGEEERRARLVAELQQARLTGVRFKVPAETMSAQLANLPEGVSVARGRIEVRFDGAENALARLFALAQALGNDYVRFEELVGR